MRTSSLPRSLGCQSELDRVSTVHSWSITGIERVELYFMKMTAVLNPIHPRMINQGGNTEALLDVAGGGGEFTKVGAGESGAFVDKRGFLRSIEERRLELAEFEFDSSSPG